MVGSGERGDPFRDGRPLDRMRARPLLRSGERIPAGVESRRGGGELAAARRGRALPSPCTRRSQTARRPVRAPSRVPPAGGRTRRASGPVPRPCAAGAAAPPAAAGAGGSCAGAVGWGRTAGDSAAEVVCAAGAARRRSRRRGVSAGAAPSRERQRGRLGAERGRTTKHANAAAARTEAATAAPASSRLLVRRPLQRLRVDLGRARRGSASRRRPRFTSPPEEGNSVSREG